MMEIRNEERNKWKATPGRIPLPKRIAMKCLDCAGGTSKEVTLCHLFSCPLWAVRFGYPQKSNQYQKRMKAAEKHYNKDVKGLKEIGINYDDFYKEHSISIIP